MDRLDFFSNRKHQQPQSPSGLPDFSKARSQQQSILDLFSFVGRDRDMDAKDTADLLRICGCQFRADNPRGSVAATLNTLCKEGHLVRVSRGRFALPDTASMQMSALLAETWEAIKNNLVAAQQRMKFVAVTRFRDDILPQILGDDRSACQNLIDEMRDLELIEIYYQENPKNPAYPTAAVRLKIS